LNFTTLISETVTFLRLAKAMMIDMYAVFVKDLKKNGSSAESVGALRFG